MVNNKLEHLKQILFKMGNAAVAYSGGVDSTLLLKVAYDCLGDQVVALTAISPSMPACERIEAEEVVQQIGARYVFIETKETEDWRYLANNPDRCYFCKSEVYGRLNKFALDNGYDYVLDGTNADDEGDYRPGQRAAQEQGVRSPLQEAGLTKAEIRVLARELGLPNWDKPSGTCLSTRIPYGMAITLETLSKIEQAELYLKKLGFRQIRVRHRDQIACIEVEPHAFEAVLSHRKQIVERLKTLGYTYVVLDLAGFRTGSMNEIFTNHVPLEKFE